jgi:hypothetical protein
LFAVATVPRYTSAETVKSPVALSAKTCGTQVVTHGTELSTVLEQQVVTHGSLY